jgi:hypothetical protein
MFGKKHEDVPETVSDGTWTRIQEGAGRQLPVIDGPWADPKARATLRAWKSARENAGHN